MRTGWHKNKDIIRNKNRDKEGIEIEIRNRIGTLKGTGTGLRTGTKSVLEIGSGTRAKGGNGDRNGDKKWRQNWEQE